MPGPPSKARCAECDAMNSPVSARVRSVPPSQIRAVHDARRATSLNLGLGQPSLDVDPAILAAGLRLMEKGSMGYTANAGLPALRAAIAAHHRIPGCDGADNVVVTCGSQEAIVAALAACLDPGDDVLIPDPAFPGYRMAAGFLGANCIAVPRAPEQGFRLDSAAIARALTPRTRAVLVVSPSNPTGMVDDKAEVAALARLADERGFEIISDEIYADLHYGSGNVPSAARCGNRTIVISGLSKNCAMTGFRLGYAVARKEMIQGILRAHSLTTSCAPSLSQYMAQFVFENPQWLKAHLPVYQERRRQALAALAASLPPTVQVLEPEGAFYVMLNVGASCENSFDFALKILDETDVIVTPGSAFGEVTRRWLRLSYADDPAIFAEGVARLGRFLAATST